MKNILRRFNEVRQSFKDAADASAAIGPMLEEQDREQIRACIAFEYPNVTFVGCEIIRHWNTVQFYLETAQYILTGRQCLAWEIELMREADEQLLSYAR